MKLHSTKPETAIKETTNAMNAPTMNDRLDYLDAVRAFALLLGIVFHASMSFVPIFIGWAVMDVSTHAIVTDFMLISHSFRMELFYLIAGFFSHLTLHRKGLADFLKSRLIRIAIPFLAGWFLMRPLLVSGWVMGGQSLQGEVQILTGLQLGFQSLSELPAGIFTGSHLWFLYYLLIITALTLIVRSVNRIFPRSFRSTVRCLDAATIRITRSPFGLLMMAIPTSVCLGFMSIWGMETPDKSLVPHVPVLLIYSGFFGFGWFLHRNQGLITHFGRLNLGNSVLAIASIVATVMLSRYQANPGHPQIEFIHASFSFSYAGMMWALTALSIGVFQRFLNRPSKTVRYLADSSYWLYLVHLPIVIWLQIAFAELPLHWSLKLAAISGLTVILSLFVYDLCVRSTWIGRLLSGKKREPIVFRRRAKSLPHCPSPLTTAANESS